MFSGRYDLVIGLEPEAHLIEFAGHQRFTLGQGAMVLQVCPAPGDDALGHPRHAPIFPGQCHHPHGEVHCRLAGSCPDLYLNHTRDVHGLSQNGSQVQETMVAVFSLGKGRAGERIIIDKGFLLLFCLLRHHKAACLRGTPGEIQGNRPGIRMGIISICCRA